MFCVQYIWWWNLTSNLNSVLIIDYKLLIIIFLYIFRHIHYSANLEPTNVLVSLHNGIIRKKNRFLWCYHRKFRSVQKKNNNLLEQKQTKHVICIRVKYSFVRNVMGIVIAFQIASLPIPCCSRWLWVDNDAFLLSFFFCSIYPVCFI